MYFTPKYVGWKGKFFWVIRIGLSSNPPESNYRRTFNYAILLSFNYYDALTFSPIYSKLNSCDLPVITAMYFHYTPVSWWTFLNQTSTYPISEFLGSLKDESLILTKYIDILNSLLKRLSWHQEEWAFPLQRPESTMSLLINRQTRVVCLYDYWLFSVDRDNG